MGLDMYLNGDDDGSVTALGYWRKHPDLHGFIVIAFAGGVDECQEIPLTKENLEMVLKATEQDKLPHTTGYFFGTSFPEDKPETIEIISAAIKWLNESPGRKVFYRASW